MSFLFTTDDDNIENVNIDDLYEEINNKTYQYDLIIITDLLEQICDCNELDTFLGWGNKLYNDGFDNWKDRIEKDV